ncbi:MAG: mandelate racemase/muconate lactonizing enzyme family protein, partial [Halobacteriales archaeon]|nr:mandelate racemase/muconate lactonizing enzyme family protein [Halobacteriales archaeon]
MSDLEITAVETYIVKNEFVPFVFARVETNQGIHGVSEATTRGKSRAVCAAIEEMAGYYQGADPFDTEDLFLRMYRDEWFSMNVVNMTAISALDMACWDIKGKALDTPVYELLGGDVHGSTLRAYANGWYKRHLDDPDEMDLLAEAAEDVVAKGYDAMKF